MDKNLDRSFVFPDIGIYLYESQHRKGIFVSEHYHEHFQILYALEGEGEITLDGKVYNFSKDKVVLISPYCIHSIKATNKLTNLVLAFSASALLMSVKDDLLSYLQGNSRYFEMDLFTASEIRSLFRKMLYEQKNSDDYSKLAMSACLIEIIIHLLRQHKITNVQDANDLRSIQIKEYIERHYFENLTAESLSNLFGISTRYMNDIFKRKFNDTPLQFLQKIRIHRAKELLLKTDQDIVSICFEVGYETLSTFYRTFRNLVGISPNKYRMTGQRGSEDQKE